MPQYSLVYFNARGRAELSRLLFAQADVQYKDERIAKEDWPAHKAVTPLGQLPYLCVDGVKIAQSNSIARYLAREFGFYGQTSLEGARIDMILDTVYEFIELAAQTKWADEKIKPFMEKKLDEKAPHYFDLLAKLLQENEGGFYVGSQVSVADFAVYHYLPQFKSVLSPAAAANLENNKSLQQHHDLIGKLPRIAKWVAKRPVTDL